MAPTGNFQSVVSGLRFHEPLGNAFCDNGWPFVRHRAFAPRRTLNARCLGLLGLLLSLHEQRRLVTGMQRRHTRSSGVGWNGSDDGLCVKEKGEYKWYRVLCISLLGGRVRTPLAGGRRGSGQKKRTYPDQWGPSLNDVYMSGPLLNQWEGGDVGAFEML